MTIGVPQPTPADPLLLPDDLSRSGAEGGDKRAARSAVVLEDEQTILVEDRGARAAVVVVEVADLLVPHELAGEVERREAVRPEGRVDALAVGHRCRRRMAVLVVGVLDARGRDRGVPQQRAVGRAVGEHRHLRAAIGRGRQKEVVLPDDWRRVPSSGHRHFPFHVRGVRPGVDVVRARHGALPRRSAPAAPVLRTFAVDWNERHRFDRRQAERRERSSADEHRDERADTTSRHAD